MNRRTVATSLAAAAAASVATSLSREAKAQTCPPECTLNVRDFGAVGDGVTDDAQAFRDAFAAAHATGGTILVPPGNFAIRSPVFVDALHGGGPITLRGCGGASKILVRSWLCFQIANVDGLCAVQDLVFVGSPWDGVDGRDCVGVLLFGGNGMTIVERCSFYGVGAFGSHLGADWASLIRAHSAPLKLVDCSFYGCFAEAGAVYADQLRGLTLTDCNFIDIGELDGVAFSKVGGAGNGPWVRVKHLSAQGFSAGMQNAVRLTRCTLDEGPGMSVVVDGPERVEQVVLEDCMFNVLGTGFGARFSNVERVRIVGGVVGWASQKADAFRLDDVGSARIRDVRAETGAKANVLRADAACRYVRVEDSPALDVQSDAALTVEIADGVTL